jgi:hypothetical protein
LEANCDKNKGQWHWAKPPVNAIANGHLVGEVPEELSCLNEVELALVSWVRIHCQSWVFHAGCHQQIKGWHTFHRNQNAQNAGHLKQLGPSGMKGSILVVLCGPFTSAQKAMTLNQVSVLPEKVIEAFEWLRDHNCHCSDEEIPAERDIPTPIIVHENEQVPSL